MTPRERAVLKAAMRRDFFLFLMKCFETIHPGAAPLKPAKYLLAMCHALLTALKSPERRLVITVPPRHLKSITAADALAAWLLGLDPSYKIMIATYNMDLARKHSNHARTIMEADWYKQFFPGTRISERGNRSTEIETTAGGGRKAVSVGGSITGFGADLIIVDDCMKADEVRSQTVRDETREWYDNSVVSRLNDKIEGVIISIQQRLHEDDLTAHLLEKGYPELRLPAIAEKDEMIPIGGGRFWHRKVGDLLNPDREPLTALERIRHDQGAAYFAAQYQQDPVAPEGNLIRLEWFGTYNEQPERHEFLKVVQSWDTGMTAAPTSDYSVGTTWGFHRDEYKWYLLDVFRQRLDFPDLNRAVVGLQRSWQAEAVLIEGCVQRKGAMA